MPVGAQPICRLDSHLSRPRRVHGALIRLSHLAQLQAILWRRDRAPAALALIGSAVIQGGSFFKYAKEPQFFKYAQSKELSATLCAGTPAQSYEALPVLPPTCCDKIGHVSEWTK